MRVKTLIPVCMALCVAIALSAGCSFRRYPGIVYCAIAQRLVSLNLDTGKETVLYTNPNMIMESVTKLDDRRFILSSRGIRIFSTENATQIFDRTTGKLSPLYGNIGNKQFLGQTNLYIKNATYLAAHHAILFYGAKNHKSRLYWAKIDVPFQRHFVDNTDALGYAYPLVQVSDDAIVYAAEHDGEEEPRLFNIQKNTLVNLDIPGCIPMLWRAKTHQLLCSKGDSFNYYLTNLDGSGREKLDIGVNHVPLYYIPELDVAIFNGTGIGFSGGLHEAETLSIYDFKTGSMTKISNNLGTGAGGLIWYPK